MCAKRGDCYRVRAKIKTRILYILAAILGGIFAFSVGQVYSAFSVGLSYGSNPASTTTYTARQGYAIINDTIDNPIPFSVGAHNYSVGLELSYSYDIDIRVKYSLEWSNGLSTNNVILNFANRDNLIVDNQYIYLVNSVPLGKHTINLITGVDFEDALDNTYYGESLQINIIDVKIYKAKTKAYDESHPLCSGINSPSRDMWLKAKNASSLDKAYVMVYNSRYDISHGILHPGAITAYGKVLDADNNITNMFKLYGNTRYAGIGLYIVTGNSAYTLTAKVVGTWRNSAGDSLSGGDNVVFDNNIKMNYSSDWVRASTGVDADYGVFNYDYTIPANTTAYINLVDSIEVTLRHTLEQTDYSSYSLVVSNININDTVFSSFDEGIAIGNINSSSHVANKQYTRPDYTIINYTKYRADLYNSERGNAPEQTYITNISVTNNTSDTLVITDVNFKLKYYRSNGQSTQYTGSDLSDYTFDGVYWYRETGILDDSYISINSTSTIIPAYTTKNIIEEYRVGSNFSTIIGKYDSWVELVVEITTSVVESDDSGLSIETSITNSNNQAIITFSVKNNQNKVFTGITANLAIEMYTPVLSNIATTIDSAEWSGTYWKYYYRESNGGFVRNLNPNYNSEENYYYSLTYTWASVTLSSYTLYNGFTVNPDDSRQFSSSIALQPNERKDILSFRTNIGGTNVIDGRSTNNIRFRSANNTVSASQASTPDSIVVVNAGSKGAYIVNNSNDDYYVRFNGTLVDGMNNIKSLGEYNYYIGIIRSGQVVKISMNAKTDFRFESVVATDTFNRTDLPDWPNEILDILEKYFK